MGYSPGVAKRQDSVTIQQQNILHIIYIENTYVCEWIIYMDGCYIWIIHIYIYIWMDHIYIYMDNTLIHGWIHVYKIHTYI